MWFSSQILYKKAFRSQVYRNYTQRRFLLVACFTWNKLGRKPTTIYDLRKSTSKPYLHCYLPSEPQQKQNNPYNSQEDGEIYSPNIFEQNIVSRETKTKKRVAKSENKLQTKKNRDSFATNMLQNYVIKPGHKRRFNRIFGGNFLIFPTWRNLILSKTVGFKAPFCRLYEAKIRLQTIK